MTKPDAESLSQPLMTVKQFAFRLGVSIPTFYETRKDPRFPKPLMVPGRRGARMQRFDPVEVEAFVEALKAERMNGAK